MSRLHVLYGEAGRWGVVSIPLAVCDPNVNEVVTSGRFGVEFFVGFVEVTR